MLGECSLFWSKHSGFLILSNDDVQGRNNVGQLGLGHTTDVYEPAGIIDFGTGFEPKAVSCGAYHTCSLSTAGALKC